jgi:hypothetical protein
LIEEIEESEILLSSTKASELTEEELKDMMKSKKETRKEVE